MDYIKTNLGVELGRIFPFEDERTKENELKNREQLREKMKGWENDTDDFLKNYLWTKDNSIKDVKEVSQDLFEKFKSELKKAAEECHRFIFDISAMYFDRDESGNITEASEFARHLLSMAYERAAGNVVEIETAKILFESISKKPENYIFPNDKISNCLTELTIDGEEQPVRELSIDAKKKVISYITFDFDEVAKATDLSEFTLNFNEFDKQVQDAVVSLMKAGNIIITAQQIYRTLTGNSGARMTENWATNIHLSMNKFNSVRVTANLEDAAKIYPKLEINKIIDQEHLMDFKKVTVETKNGTTITGYKMYAYPILYTIADLKGLVGCFDMKLLENGKTTNSIDNTELKIYLLKRINAMKHATTKMRNSILLETLYNALSRTTQKEKRTTRENTEKLLLQFVADKVITDFKIEIKGRSPYKIIITLNDMQST